MDWGQIQIESLRKMYLNNKPISIDKLEEYKQDKKYQTYLEAMPQAANEAINYILENGKPLIKSFQIEKNSSKYNLKEIINNYKRLYEISCSSDIKPIYHFEGDSILVIDRFSDGDITIYYEAYPKVITEETESSEKIDVDFNYACLIPLYIAGELYKDDDISLATMYMNEFITNVNNLNGKDFSLSSNRIETIYSM